MPSRGNNCRRLVPDRQALIDELKYRRRQPIKTAVGLRKSWTTPDRAITSSAGSSTCIYTNVCRIVPEQADYFVEQATLRYLKTWATLFQENGIQG